MSTLEEKHDFLKLLEMDERIADLEDRKVDRQEKREKTSAREAREKYEFEQRMSIEAAQAARQAQEFERSLLLMQAVVVLASTANQAAQALVTQMMYGDDSKIRAQACGFLVAAAQQKGDPQSLEAAAERLLEISGAKPPVQINSKRKVG